MITTLYEPYGVAVDTNSNTFYLTESASGVVLQYDSNSGALTAFAGLLWIALMAWSYRAWRRSGRC